MDSHSSNLDPSAAAAAAAGFGVVILVIALIATVVQVVICWRIASKAGYNGVMSLLTLIPIVNLVVILMFAFSEWPVQRELNIYRAGGGGVGGGGFGTPMPTWTPPTPPSAGPYLPPGA